MRQKRKDGFSFDFSSLEFDFGGDDEPKLTDVAHLTAAPVCFDNAVELAERIEPGKDLFCFAPGTFIFGDLIEALLVKKNLQPSAIYIATLGMSAENIDSLYNLTHYLGCKRLKLLISNYFAAMERNKLVPYFEREFQGEPIDVAVLASHCKLALIRSDKGDMLFSGSANLSSSNNVEQFVLMHDKAVIDFVQERLDHIFDKFTVYHGDGDTDWSKNKHNTGAKAWDAIK